MGDGLTTFVFDNGSLYTKAGYAGEESPIAVFPTVVGNYKKANTIELKNSYVGDEAVAKLPWKLLRHPVNHGLIKNFEDMTKVWHHSFYSELRNIPNDSNVILTEPLMNYKTIREKSAQVFFEEFNVNGFYIGTTNGFSMYTTCRATITEVEMGDGVISFVSFNEGYPLPNSAKVINIGGEEITDFIFNSVMANNEPFKTTHFDRIIARDIKEHMCYFASNFNEEIEKSSTQVEKVYMLPDGERLIIGKERFLAPEALLQPSTIGSEELGIHQNIYNSIMKCGADIRQSLFMNLVITGGSSMFDNLSIRISKEMSTLVPQNYKTKVIENTDIAQKYSAWIGASIIGSTSLFDNEKVSKSEYDEFGTSVINKKCFVYLLIFY
ncbi:actin, putative [Entamoeba invadens IP1]|uniref:Actin, putative n=1 Tax=Entamoeba invadens IP1 TaxID=370355 RepID=A0A0A1U6Z2_ENTIV|nr:actin, putative [Entamoeba invadens IP1]ELP90178.1 actin, putative [Entamoeba invadens IP1]|eukprot:XP_004256949.1 actin, putative [Entamoeba invadens IP1]